MKACRTASIVAFGALFVASAIGACREPEPVTVPPPTSALPSAPPPVAPTAAPVVDSGAAAVAKVPPPSHLPVIAFIDSATRIDGAPICSTLYLVAAKGTTKAAGETLAAGDILVIAHPSPIEVKVTGLAVSIIKEVDCAILSRPAATTTVVRAKDAPALEFAGGKMTAHLDVGTKISPALYVGRLEGTAPMAEHEHADSTEIMIAIEASGTYTLDGVEHRLGPRQISVVPMKTKHSYKPDRGSKLVGIQLYDPPGPEQRFIALSAAQKASPLDSSH